MAAPKGDSGQMKKPTRSGGKSHSVKAKCKYRVEVFGCGYHGKKVVVRLEHKHDLMSQMYEDLNIPQGEPFELEIYNKEWKDFETLDITQLPDEATLRLRFGGSEVSAVGSVRFGLCRLWRWRRGVLTFLMKLGGGI